MLEKRETVSVYIQIVTKSGYHQMEKQLVLFLSVFSKFLQYALYL